MKTIITFFLGLLPISLSLFAGNTDTSRLRLLFTGDIMGHDAQIFSAYDDATGIHNYDTCFSLVSPYFQAADIVIGNLEVTLAGPSYTGYPAFSSPDALAVSLKKAGFDLLITANNHSLDRGKAGLERTLKVLDSLALLHTGTFRNQTEKDITYPLIIEKHGIRLAILNYTYGTNGIAVRPPNVVNYIDTVLIARDLRKAELAEPDFTIVTMHWGIEYERLENKTQRDLGRFILSHGADAVIGMHPHVVQPITMEHYQSPDSGREKLVAYSLGNFISNQRERYRNGGIVLELELEKHQGHTALSTYNYLPVYVHKPYRDKLRSWFVLIPASANPEWIKNLGLNEVDTRNLNTFFTDTVEHLGEERLLKWPE
jgi:poly-gamma-glutamate synthesis protein (capsule biosynthesis protein)